MPFVEKHLIPISFHQGINTKIDSKQIPAGELLSLQNGRFQKPGQLNKRYGYSALNKTIEGGGSIQSGAEITSYQDQLILFDGLNIYSYLPSTGNWSNRGTAIAISTLDDDILRRSDAQQLNPDSAFLNGIELYAWEDSRGGIRYSTLDTSTKAFALSDSQMSSFGQQPKTLSFQNQIIIFYEDGGNNLYYQLVNSKNPTTIQPTLIIAGDGYAGTNGFPFDAQIIGTQIVVSYLSNSTPSGAIQLFTIDSGFNKSSTTTIINNIPGQTINAGFHGAISVIPDASNNIWVAWANGVDIRVAAYTYNINSLLSTTLVDTGDCRVLTGIQDYTSNQIKLFYEIHASQTYNELTKYLTISTTGILSSSSTIRSVGINTRPFSFNNRIFINLAYQSTLQSTDFIFYIAPNNTSTIIGKCTPLIAGGLQTNGMCPQINLLSNGIFKFANNQAGRLLSEANTQFTILGVNSTQLNFLPSDNFSNTVQSNTLLITGGILQGYDGVQTTELGFHIYPENITATPNGSGGSLSNGTYFYKVVYKWTDNNGQIHYSTDSIAVQTNTVNNDSVTLQGSTLRLTSKSKVQIEIYRTTTSDAQTFRRITSVLIPLINDPTTDTWSFLDQLSDTSLLSNNIIYTTGNVLSNYAPPANTLITTYGDRAFLSGMSDPLLIWYSQSVPDNSNQNLIPPQFSQNLILTLDPRGDDITALGVINQTFIVFKKDKIFAFQGNGPDATANNNDFQVPQLVTTDVGCINSNSVVIVPMGLMFLSEKGIYLIDESLNTSYIGDKVEDLISNLNITGAIENPQDNEIIFTSSNGTALVYDYYIKQWSTWTNHFAVSSTIYNNLFTYLNSSGQVYVQNRSSFTDNGTPILMSFTLPNLSFAGLSGYQKVFSAYILGSYKGPHTLNVQVAYDNNSSYSEFATLQPFQSSTWGSGQVWGDDGVWGSASQLYTFRVDFKSPSCSSIRLNISDNQTSSYNEGYSISSISFLVGIVPGGNRIPQNQIYGSK